MRLTTMNRFRRHGEMTRCIVLALLLGCSVAGMAIAQQARLLI